MPIIGVAEGSKAHVIDTGEEYIFHDGTWELDLRGKPLPFPMED